MARVAVEEPVRLARARIDVAVQPPDHERVALQHADLSAVHRLLLIRWSCSGTVGGRDAVRTTRIDPPSSP
jgi:hypothetical protein